MNHSALHKTTSKKRESEVNRHGHQKVKRRSFAQKQKRDLILEKQRDLSPLKETNRQELDKDKCRKERLRLWKEQQKKKREEEKRKAKPVFKVSSVIKRDGKPAPPKGKQPTKEAPAKMTRSQTLGQRKPVTRTSLRSEGGKQTTKATAATRPPKNKPNKGQPKAEKQTKQNVIKSKERADPIKERTDVPIATDVSKGKKKSKEQPKIEEKNRSSDQKAIKTSFSVSFAPRDFRFKPPTGLKLFQFDSTLPSSNESFVSKGGAMNFISSTPRLPNVAGVKKTVVPMILSSASASGSSSDENGSVKTLIRASQQSTETPVEDGNSVEHSASFNKIKSEGSEKGKKVQYFRNLISAESEKLKSSCRRWEGVQEQNGESLTEEVVGEIRSVIGQAQLLMAERFVQFSGLIDKFENPKPEHNPVTPTDLKGFWDMIYFQVEDVVKKFNNLESLKEKKWQKEEENKKRTTRKKKATTKSTKGSSAHRQAARQRIQKAREAMRLRQEKKNSENRIESADLPDAEMANSGTKFTLEANERRSEETTSSQDEGVQTRSRRKTPGGKNVSLVTPRSKKRKARFAAEETSHDSHSTPNGSRPRKRVMRKTPLPMSKSESAVKVHESEEIPSSGEDVQASPTLKKQTASVEPLAPEVQNDQDEMKGLRLNFDDIESDDGGDSLPTKYLLPPSAPDSPAEDSEPAKRSSMGLDRKYLISSEIDSSICSDSLSSSKVLAKSPGRVLRNSRKSYHNPISPFLPKLSGNQNPESTQGVEDLMSFSPLAAK